MRHVVALVLVARVSNSPEAFVSTSPKNRQPRPAFSLLETAVMLAVLTLFTLMAVGLFRLKDASESADQGPGREVAHPAATAPSASVK